MELSERKNYGWEKESFKTFRRRRKSDPIRRRTWKFGKESDGEVKVRVVGLRTSGKETPTNSRTKRLLGKE